MASDSFHYVKVLCSECDWFGRRARASAFAKGCPRCDKEVVIEFKHRMIDGSPWPVHKDPACSVCNPS